MFAMLPLEGKILRDYPLTRNGGRCPSPFLLERIIQLCTTHGSGDKSDYRQRKELCWLLLAIIVLVS